MDNKYGVTEYGFRRKLYPECLAERIKRAKDVFGVNIDTSETSFLGKLIRNTAWDETYLWELAEDVYNSAFVNSAVGTGLDNVGQYLTITRRPATKSVGIITIYGDDGTVIDVGFRIATESGIVFETLDSGVITDGFVELPIGSIGLGDDNNVAAETITKIINPTLGVTSAINYEDTEGGLNIETDKEFRERYKKSYARVGGSTLPAITAALLDMDRVIDAEVRENVTMETIGEIPPKSIACYVYGTATDEEIAQTILENKAGGIQAYGEIYVDIKDKFDKVHRIGFSRAEIQEIWVKLVIRKDEGYKGDDATKRAILNYIGGIDSDNIQYDGLKLGKDVIISKVIGAIMCMGGIAEVDAYLSTNGTDYTPTNIEIANNTIARVSPDRIVIEYEDV